MKLEKIKEGANKLGYKVVKKSKTDLLQESNTKCVRCLDGYGHGPENPGKAVYYANEYPICQDCYNRVSMY